MTSTCDVMDSSNIMAVSYIVAQVFKHQIGSQFHDTPHTQPFLTICSDHLTASAFLCTQHTLEITQNSLKISMDNWKLFKDIKDNGKKVLRALKTFKQKADVAEDDQ